MMIPAGTVVETINGVGYIVESRCRADFSWDYLICIGKPGFAGDSDVYHRGEFEVLAS